jgi:hypothetical protein
MPYIIEVYSPSKTGALLLRDIITHNRYDTKDQAQSRITEMLTEQEDDNNKMLLDYYHQLESDLMDETISDTIPCEPRLYNYSYKAVKLSNRAINNIP